MGNLFNKNWRLQPGAYIKEKVRGQHPEDSKITFNPPPPPPANIDATGEVGVYNQKEPVYRLPRLME